MNKLITAYLFMREVAKCIHASIYIPALFRGMFVHFHRTWLKLCAFLDYKALISILNSALLHPWYLIMEKKIYIGHLTKCDKIVVLPQICILKYLYHKCGKGITLMWNSISYLDIYDTKCTDAADIKHQFSTVAWMKSKSGSMKFAVYRSLVDIDLVLHSWYIFIY